MTGHLFHIFPHWPRELLLPTRIGLLFVMEMERGTNCRKQLNFREKNSPSRDHLWFDHEADPADNDKHAAGQVDLEHGPAFGQGQLVLTRPG